MKRKEIHTAIGESINIDADYSTKDKLIDISDIIDELTDSRNKGATHITIEVDVDGHPGSALLHPIKIELESDESYNERILESKSKALAAENVIKVKEKALYEELKLKYGE